MTKNYFTDSQVAKIVSDSFTVSHGEITLTLTHSHIKALMNLAVEAAIGDSVAWRICVHPRGDYIFQRHPPSSARSDLWQPLYSVKELEN